MKRIKFRYYSEVPYNVRVYSKDFKTLETSFDNDLYGNIEKVSNEEVELVLPKAYWREGMFLLPRLKDKKAEKSRNGMFGYSTYQGLFFYNGEWFIHEVQEDSLDRLDLHHPGEKEYEFLLQIPYSYLNRYYYGYKQHFYWVKQIHQVELRAKLARYRIIGK
jgi:hypothetical protein